jgi:tetratricopeptide (TPR) repeat protein
MPRIRPSNVAHAAITNHLISIPAKQPVSDAKTVGARLTAWRTPAPEFAERNLGLALFATGSIKDYGKIFQSYQILSHLPQRDAEVLATLGSILLEQRHADFAVNLYRQALAAAPGNARYAYVLGSALYAQGNQEAAIAELRHSIELDRSLPAPYVKLMEIYGKLKQPELSRQVRDEYLKFMPQNMSFREAGK